MYEINLIAAMDNNRGIGLGNKLPWQRIPEDMKWFKKQTLKKPCIVGRRTFEGMGGKPLVDRTMIVLSSKPTARNDVYWAFSVEQAIDYGKAVADQRGTNEIMVIGGAEVYKAFLPHATRLIFTLINHAYQCDTWFPDIDVDEWRNDFQDNQGSLTFLILNRIARNDVNSIRVPISTVDKSSYSA